MKVTGHLSLSLPCPTPFSTKDRCPEKRKTMAERFLMDGVTNNNQRLKTEVTEESDETDKIN